MVVMMICSCRCDWLVPVFLESGGRDWLVPVLLESGGVGGKVRSIVAIGLEVVSCKGEDISGFLNEQGLQEICQQRLQLRIGSNVFLVLIIQLILHIRKYK